MLRIAVSGHRGLSADTAGLVDETLRADLLHFAPEIVGLSCLADGADQLFARAVIELGGAIEAIIPAEKYREGLPADAHAEYDDLRSRATKVHRLTYTESTAESHMAASAYMLEHADELWAIWDGQPARAYGGTADVVAHAHAQHMPVRIIWPQGAQRD